METQRRNRAARRRIGVALAGLGALLLPGLILARAVLVLQDGQTIQGVDLKREGSNYLVELESGETLPIPVELVREVRLEETERPRVHDPSSGVTYTDPVPLAGPKKPPPGLRATPPRTLVGRPVAPPQRSEQLRVLGAPSRFPASVVDSSWRPTSSWNLDPQVTNNFNPARWARSPIDPSWEPKPAFGSADVLSPSQAKWPSAPLDPSWAPQDGFQSRQW